MKINREIESIYSNNNYIIDILLSFLSQNRDYTEYLQTIVDSIVTREEETKHE